MTETERAREQCGRKRQENARGIYYIFNLPTRLNEAGLCGSGNGGEASGGGGGEGGGQRFESAMQTDKRIHIEQSVARSDSLRKYFFLFFMSQLLPPRPWSPEHLQPWRWLDRFHLR